MIDEQTTQTTNQYDPETDEVYENDAAELALSDAGTALVHSLNNQSDAALMGLNFDPDTAEGVKRVFNAQEDGDSLHESGLSELVADGIIIQPGVRVDPVTGSRIACANTIILCHDGKNLVSQSNGIARTAARIINLYSHLGWPEEGVALKLVEKKLDHGRTYKKLVLA